MTATVGKLSLTAAAISTAAAAFLSPVANADLRVPQAPSDSSSSDDNAVGGAAGKARDNRGANIRTGRDTSPDTPSTSTPGTSAAGSGCADANSKAKAVGSNALLQNPLWWFGTPNPTPPPSTIITETEPLADLPGWMRPSLGWFTETNVEVCVLGLSNKTVGTVGPYGTGTTSFSRQGC